MQKEIFDGEEYDVYYDENGDKVLHIDKDRDGFEITLTLTGTPEERKEAREAVINFIVNSI